jgi:omega-6 fatty acid desaturase (delta-12 desaturase)
MYKRSSVAGVRRFLVLAAGYAVVFLGIAAVPGFACKLIGSIILFLITFHFALLGHDAGHGHATSSSVLNRWIGRLSFLMSYVPFSAWLAGHNALHHGYTNLRGKDPHWAPLSKTEYDALSPMERLYERICRSPFGVMLGNMRDAWSSFVVPNAPTQMHIPNRTTLRLEQAATLGVLVLQVAGVLTWQSYLEQAWDLPAEPVAGLLAAILVPHLLLNWWTGMLSFVHHTHPKTRWYATVADWRKAQTEVECSVHLVAPWWIECLLGNSLEHTAHHVAPKVGEVQQSEIQHQLEESQPEIIQKVHLFDCLQILAACKLYDYENHRWLDFDGNVTSETAQ